MTNATAINSIGPELACSDNSTLQRSLRRWTAALFTTAIFGAVSGLVGLAVGIVTFLELVAPSTALYTTSTFLIGASFILFGLTAHCVDRVDAFDKELRLEYCRYRSLHEQRRAGSGQ